MTLQTKMLAVAFADLSVQRRNDIATKEGGAPQVLEKDPNIARSNARDVRAATTATKKDKKMVQNKSAWKGTQFT